MYKLHQKSDSPGIMDEVGLSQGVMEKSFAQRLIKYRSLLPFVHSSFSIPSTIRCGSTAGKTNLFLLVIEMLPQKTEREEDYEEHFSRSLVPRKSHLQKRLTRGSCNTVGAVTAVVHGKTFCCCCCCLPGGQKHCGVKNFWRAKEKEIHQVLENRLSASVPTYSWAFVQHLFFKFSLNMKLKERKVTKQI